MITCVNISLTRNVKVPFSKQKVYILYQCKKKPHYWDIKDVLDHSRFGVDAPRYVRKSEILDLMILAGMDFIFNL